MNEVLVFEEQQVLQKLADTPGVISNAKDLQILEKNAFFDEKCFSL